MSTLQEDVTVFLDYLRLIRRSAPNTITSYGSDLRALIATLGEDQETETITANTLRKHLAASKIGPASRARHVYAMRAFWRFLVRTKRVSANAAASLITPRLPVRLPRPVPKPVLDRLLDTPGPETARGKRDTAIIEFLYASGVRVSELVSLTLEGLDIEARSARVIGKGDKERLVIFGRACARALKIWLAVRNASESVRAVFVGRYGRALSTRHIRRILIGRAHSIGIARAPSPHQFRHSTATDLMNGGADLLTIRSLLGHAHVGITARYMHVSTARLESQAALHPLTAGPRDKNPDRGIRALGNGRYRIAVRALDPKTGEARKLVRKVRCENFDEARGMRKALARELKVLMRAARAK